ncbi:DUF4232 domain-containing protein [Streptomyces sp. NBC_00264]|uniref:DUF4232 domain-containing protein n=1 Tax=unclassified Streptomyces TaxID=2593676 RepID=UPI0022549CCD|nr:MULTISPECIES: DUF4232 domain-containing protein [unclassified Streptomyces]MCX5159428.1 DUF4232 domain-containing protein [Streptomyces sp. NBC_00305]MCX5217951.1 DUF4232 domain-containing protein [Streptomyces sp. NBC_00264]WSP52145.1 DUF4232 domain-containing protein [Streptomyces sp. NBC_01243]WSX06847.1 DUF4232 domain-containing protein [Streptomyces sp. NBC_00987]
MRGLAGAGTGRRRPLAAGVLAGVLGLTLSGCAGFLVPAGEGEPEPTPGDPYRVHADKLPTPFPSASAGVADRPGAQGPAPTPTVPAGCPSSGVVVDMGEVEAALGHRAVGLSLTNCGSKPYRVTGYPSVRALDEAGDPLPVPVNPGSSYMGTDRGPKEVMLKPGQTVRSLLAWVSTPTGGDLIEGDALEIAAAPGLEGRTFPLKGSDVRLLDELNMTAWRTDPA